MPSEDSSLHFLGVGAMMFGTEMAACLYLILTLALGRMQITLLFLMTATTAFMLVIYW